MKLSLAKGCLFLGSRQISRKTEFIQYSVSKIAKGRSNIFVSFNALCYQVMGAKTKREEHLQFAELVLKVTY